MDYYHMPTIISIIRVTKVRSWTAREDKVANWPQISMYRSWQIHWQLEIPRLPTQFFKNKYSSLGTKRNIYELDWFNRPKIRSWRGHDRQANDISNPVKLTAGVSSGDRFALGNKNIGFNSTLKLAHLTKQKGHAKSSVTEDTYSKSSLILRCSNNKGWNTKPTQSQNSSKMIKKEWFQTVMFPGIVKE